MERLHDIYRPVAERVRDFREVERALAPGELSAQVARCQNCGVPFCHGAGCPLGNRVPDQNRAAAHGDWRRAWELLSSTSDFPEFTSRVCPALCEAACVRQLDEAIAGGAKGRKNVIMLTLGTGVGGGVILGGRLFCGGDSMGAELGHSVLVSGGVRCTCGIEGCLESYASVTALIRQTREAMAAHPESLMNAWEKEHGTVNGRTSFECAKAGDAAALAVVDAYEEYLANGIGSLVNIFRPDVVLIGGGLSNEGEYLLRPVREKLPRYTFASDIIGTSPVERALLGNDAGIIGAACLDML